LDLERILAYVQDGEDMFEFKRSVILEPIPEEVLAKKIGIFTVSDATRDEENTFKIVELDETVSGGCTYE